MHHAIPEASQYQLANIAGCPSFAAGTPRIELVAVLEKAGEGVDAGWSHGQSMMRRVARCVSLHS